MAGMGACDRTWGHVTRVGGIWQGRGGDMSQG